jgi:ARG/rhodanese/phosphatase superfamily protein
MDTTRRHLLFGSTIGALGALTAPAWAWAETRLRLLEGAPDPGQPPLMGQVSPDFQRWMRGIRVGQAVNHGALHILWLHATDQAASLDVSTLDEARKDGSLLITEHAQAQVPELVVENRGKVHVLLLAGEILVGGKQNRVLREDILLPPLSGPRPIGVYCVEQGRWNEGRKDFESKGTLAQPRVRSKLLEKADQNRIWDSVARASREVAPATPSPTHSYQAIYDDRQVQAHLKEVERAVIPGQAGAHGAAAFAGGTLTGLDLFHTPSLFSREWPKLLRAHAVEAYRVPASKEPQDSRSRARVEALLAQAGKTEGSLRGNAGVGQLFEFRVESNRGAALIAESRVIHTAIL